MKVATPPAWWRAKHDDTMRAIRANRGRLSTEARLASAPYTGETRNCRHCGEPFKIKKIPGRRHTYCSARCKRHENYHA